MSMAINVGPVNVEHVCGRSDMGRRHPVINSLDISMSPPQLLNMPLSSPLDGNVPSLSHAPHRIHPDKLPPPHPKQPDTLVREQRKRRLGRDEGRDGDHQEGKILTHSLLSSHSSQKEGGGVEEKEEEEEGDDDDDVMIYLKLVMITIYASWSHCW
ncbi:hypothetical protein H920_07197 [Fukomys damarensis]|uniref:Uncharacterized protein n=1 Tax=Fukomys damarensis TaxID=885580 RepID=A0A091DJV0_FUKDA|nr:hypothetical protein H920_07197 [Fukomys damarensis]